MDDIEIDEIFSGLGPVAIKRLFGGKGIYFDGLIIGIVMRGELLLKADAETAPRFEAAGSAQWAYDGRRGKRVHMPYWSIPAEAFDDPDAMARWVKLAYQAARTGAADGDGLGPDQRPF
ncbi:MAG TPA: TfoX/Sxy family protein [Caulobacteraceae bacterium]|jgi:DNA transformation protein|nr:TfoX/Sxy family protein [Caulobacteraceae bacterium]